jgi:hypothetical protein
LTVILLAVDGAGWHKSNDLEKPNNIKFFEFPAYAPEMNPIINTGSA